ncbi:HK97 family phage prohead protease [Aureliella helgolandensis]|uniref:Caudovirus prohead protease n=1 Tax=Aureliella helgolandensis TaxID=2527968 RepID=A0A518GEA4_9BACT|nr:hypothetical protein [Aureliella helgolandensis]QDV26931.1 hypothetical protein Q31a_53110 [Aureliella helgolandensis]
MKKFDPSNPTQAPADAFAFAASECKWEAATERKNGLRRMPVNVLARTGAPVYHWYWDSIVHDFEGLVHKPKIAFDYRHDPNEPIGVADKFTVNDAGLWLDGELISRDPKDEAAKIMDLGPAGIPYEASIHFNPATAVMEYLPEGFTTTVNGQEIAGPQVIVRKWELLRCAFCLTGVDGGSQANFEAGEDSPALFSLNWTDKPMTKTTPTTPATDGKETEAGKQSTDSQKPETSATKTEGTPVDRAQFENEFKAQLGKFTAKFGAADGAEYFSQGLSYEQGLEKHCAKLEQSAKDATVAQSTAEDKLAKLDLGETQGVDTGTGKGKQGAKFEDLFRSAAGTEGKK